MINEKIETQIRNEMGLAADAIKYFTDFGKSLPSYVLRPCLYDIALDYANKDLSDLIVKFAQLPK